LAVAVIVIVTGAGPQSNVTMPPAATALTTAAEVQLAAVPVPTVRVGWLVSTGRAAAGTGACPLGLPGFGSVTGATGRDGETDGATDEGGGAGEDGATADGALDDGATKDGAAAGDEHPLSSSPATAARETSRFRTGRW